MVDLMPTRYEQLVATTHALAETGVPLVQLRDGEFLPAGLSDDPGLYLFIPWIAQTFNLSVTQATDALLILFLGMATLSAVVGFSLVMRTSISRAYAFAVVAGLAYVALRRGDVYLFAFATPAALVPWILLYTQPGRSQRTLFGLAVIAGALSSGAHLMRSHSATAVLLIFIVLLTAAGHLRVAAKTIIALVMVASFMIVQLAMANVVETRDEFLRAQNPSYTYDRAAHPFWHSAYIGLGYKPNPYVPAYRDEFAAAKVREIDPDAGYLSERYEQVLKAEMMKIALADPGFFLGQALAKVRNSLYWVVVTMNVGIFAFLLKRPPPATTVAFGLAIAFSMLPVVLTVPDLAYQLGLFTFSAFFAAVCVDCAVITYRKPPLVTPISG